MNLLVRRYEDTDYEEVNSIIKKCFDVTKSKIKNDNNLEFVCEYNNVIVGYFILSKMFDIVKNLKFYFVEYVCVDNDYQGLGIGTKMMEEAISFCKSDGASYIELTSGYKRKAAHRVYEKVGFVKRESNIFRKEL